MGSQSPCNVHIHSGLHPDELRLELDKLYHHLKDLIMATKKDVVDAIEASRAASAAETAALSGKVNTVIKLLTELRNGGGATAAELDEVLRLVNAAGAEDVAGDKAVEAALDSALTPPAPLTLTSLLISAGSLSPAFDPAVLSYTVDEAADVTSVMFSATASEPAATLSVAGKDVQSGAPSDPVTLIQGANPVEVRVTRLASTPPAVVVYTVIVNVAAPADTGAAT